MFRKNTISQTNLLIMGNHRWTSPKAIGPIAFIPVPWFRRRAAGHHCFQFTLSEKKDWCAFLLIPHTKILLPQDRVEELVKIVWIRRWKDWASGDWTWSEKKKTLVIKRITRVFIILWDVRDSNRFRGYYILLVFPKVLWKFRQLFRRIVFKNQSSVLICSPRYPFVSACIQLSNLFNFPFPRVKKSCPKIPFFVN